ncbi:hypothetical protein ACIPJ2_16180 [Curtobacterium sp. NPDC090217]|uniref:hypothetical protein n=1 Tax=Curtobacterium sp. NPDC090217 TaxID=3363970 RepID=UPI003828C999
MSAFTPTTAERKKYADYDVQFRDAKSNSVRVGIDENGEVIRWLFQIHRLPSEKLFVVFIYQGATASEVEEIERVCAALPNGEWARFPGRWWRSRYRSSARVFYRQTRGFQADDPFTQLELEMLIDATSEVTV